MSERDDLDLRQRFAEARELDSAGAPSFEDARRRVVRSGRLATLLPAAMLAGGAAMIAAVVLTRTPQPDDSISQAAALSSWTAPTDDWLALTGLEIPDSVPSLSPSSVPLPDVTTATDTGEIR